MNLALILKWLLFPGVNLHARLRYRVIPSFFDSNSVDYPRRILDAGCGNGMLSYQAYLRGNSVLGVSIKEGEIRRNRELFNVWLRIPEERLCFQVYNLYDIGNLGLTFDEIICCEVLEHIRDDHRICESFFEILNPGGVLHLCCPNADHPDNQSQELDDSESGGHVRPGYTWESYRRLLEPIGFELSPAIGLGGPIRQRLNRYITQFQQQVGLGPAILFFLISYPLLALDADNPRVPYSLYIRARKPM
ncbi:MAG: class I SAM-dependent methyltransferase [Candidatus Hadarchaeum sp.]